MVFLAANTIEYYNLFFMCMQTYDVHNKTDIDN